MESNESPYLLLTWLQSGSEEMQLSALEQLCLALLQYETNEALIKFYPPSMYVPILSCLCQDFDISFLLLEAIIRTMTYYMQAVPHEVINSLVNTKGTLMAICMRLENPNMEISIESDLTQQIIKLLEELCKRDTKSLSNIGGASYIINFLSKSHQIIHLDTIKSGFYILYKIIDKIDPNDKRLGEWFEFLAKFLKNVDNRIVEYSLHCLLAIIKMCNEKKIATDPLGIEKIIDDLLEMIVLQLKIDNNNTDDVINRNDMATTNSSNRIGLSRAIIDLILCIIRGSTRFLCNLLINNKLSGILLEIISQYDSASTSILQLIEGIYDQISERISYHSEQYTQNFKILPQSGFRMIHGRIYNEEMFQQYTRYHDFVMKDVTNGNLDGLKELLLSTDFDPRYKDKWGQTPLNLAAALGFVEGVNLLLSRGIDPNLGERASSFHYAAAQGHLCVLATLLKNDSLDTSMRDCEGCTIIERMKQFIQGGSDREKVIEMENLVMRIESQTFELNSKILQAKKYFIKRMTPVLINIYFKNYKNSLRCMVLELLNKVFRSFNDQDHDTFIKEFFQNDILPYQLLKMIYRVLLQDTGENVLEAIKLSLCLTVNEKHSQFYLKWFYRMGIKDILIKSIESFSSLSPNRSEISNISRIIPLDLDAEFSDFTPFVGNPNNSLNLNQPYYWGDWNIISVDNGLHLYIEHCYVFVRNDEMTKSLHTSVLLRHNVIVASGPMQSKKNVTKNQIFNHFTKENSFKYKSNDKSNSDGPENGIGSKVDTESDYDAIEIVDSTVTHRPDLVKSLLEKYSTMLASLQLVGISVPFPKLTSARTINIRNLVIINFSNHLKISLGIDHDNLLQFQSNSRSKDEVLDKSLSDENVFIEISINKISGFMLRSLNQIFYKSGPLNLQGGYKRLEPLKSVTERIWSLRKPDNSIRQSICHRIIVNGNRQLTLLDNFKEVQNKFAKNVSQLHNAVNSHKSIDKNLYNINRLFSSETSKPTPYELLTSKFLAVLLTIVEDDEYVDKFVSIFQLNLSKLSKMIIQLLEQMENLPNTHQQHSYISDHYLTRALHVRAVLRNCNDPDRFDLDPIPDLSKYNFLVMPLSSPINIKNSIQGLLQKLPWYRADKMSFNTIRELRCEPFFVEIEFEGSESRGGFFQWLGTNGFRATFMNPLKLNLISVSLSENNTNVFNSLFSLFILQNDVNKNALIKNYVSIKGSHSFLTIYLKHPLGLIPKRYSIGRPPSEEGVLFSLLNWQLMASIDGINWDILSVHQNDTSLRDSNNGKYWWSLDISSSLLDKVKGEGWTVFKIQQISSNPLISEDGNETSSVSHGFWLNHIEFYGTVFAISDSRQEEIKSSIDDYLSKFQVGALVNHVSHCPCVNNDDCATGKIVDEIKNGTVLVQWENKSGISHMRHKMGAQGKYELTLSYLATDKWLESCVHRPKTFTDSFVESKSSFEIHPESHDDRRNSFPDSISWIIDPNISAPLRTSSMSSQFPPFFNKENFFETIANKDAQNVYKKRRDVIKDFQDYNTLIKSETEYMDLRYENSDEENFRNESATVKSFMQSRMEFLDTCSGGSKPAIQFGGKYSDDIENNIDIIQTKKVKSPEESKRNFSLSKDTKRKSYVALSEVKRDVLKIKDNVDEIDMSDDSEYFEISQDVTKYLRQTPKLENAKEVSKTKPYLKKKYYNSFIKTHKYIENFTGIGESSTKFKPVNVLHQFPGLVQSIDSKSSPHPGEIRSNIEVLHYRQEKVLNKAETNIKSKSFGFDPQQFQMKLEIQIPESVKFNFEIQKSVDLELSATESEKCKSTMGCTSTKHINGKRVYDFMLSTKTHYPIVDHVLCMLPLPDRIINSYHIESISQSWYSQFTVYYGFCDKINGNSCKNCFFQKKLGEDSPTEIKRKSEDQVDLVMNVINSLKTVQMKTNMKLLSPHSIFNVADPVMWTDSCFISHQIGKTLLNQLEDVWGLLSKDTLPTWVSEWPLKYPFIFSYEVRVDMLNAYWLGSSRSVYWLQQKTKPNVDFVRPSFREEVPSPFHFLGRLKKHIAHVPRPFYFGNTTMTDTETRSLFWLAVKDLFKFHAGNKEELEIQFELEEGTGLGPTLEFMNILSIEFMRIDTFMWVHSDSNESETGEHVYSENGIFPYPWPLDKINEDLLERFHILGIFIAKCIQDNRRIDIPFSETFLKLLSSDIVEYDEERYLEDFSAVYIMRGKFLKSLSKFCKEKKAHLSKKTVDSGEQLKSIAAQVLGSNFENLCIDMEFLPTTKVYGLDPCSLSTINQEMCDKNRSLFPEPVSEMNAEKYLEETLKFTMNHGIRRQIAVMKDGFNKVFPIRSLAMFSAVELKQLICGEQDIKWTLEELYQFTEPTQGYTKRSQNYRYFLEVLEEMVQPERKMFIQFITGCTSLPPGGLKNLKPRLTVVRKNLLDGGPYPSVNTCMHYLKLPEYQSKSELKSRLMDASSQHGFHLN